MVSEAERIHMRFAIFKASFPIRSGPILITFTALMNPAKPSEVMAIEAVDAEAAIVKTTALLKLLDVSTHTILGNSDLETCEFPDFFMGELNDQDANMYDTASIAYRISTFRGTNKK